MCARRRKSSLPFIWRELGIPVEYRARRQLPLQREANRLVVVARKTDGRPVALTPRAAAAWRRMQIDAKADGVVLLAVSGFRSVARQTKIIRAKIASGESIEKILRFIAAPGCSEHHTGRALDIGSINAPDLMRGSRAPPSFVGCVAMLSASVFIFLIRERTSTDSATNHGIGAGVHENKFN